MKSMWLAGITLLSLGCSSQAVTDSTEEELRKRKDAGADARADADTRCPSGRCQAEELRLSEQNRRSLCSHLVNEDVQYNHDRLLKRQYDDRSKCVEQGKFVAFQFYGNSTFEWCVTLKVDDAPVSFHGRFVWRTNLLGTDGDWGEAIYENSDYCQLPPYVERLPQ